MKLKKEQQMGVPPKLKVMRYSYRIAFFLLACFLPVFLQEVKAQKYIKLAKNILYKGENANKRPHGRGTLIVVTDDMKNTVFTITGTFQGNEITDNEMSSPGLLISSGFDRVEVDTLTFSKVVYSIDEKTGLSLELIEPTYNIKLSYSFDKQRKKWKQDVLFCLDNVVNTYYREATTSIPSNKGEFECTMHTIDLSSDLLDGIGLVQGYIKLANNILYKGERVNKRPHGRGTLIVVTDDMKNTVFTITGTFQGNEITDNNISSPGISFNTGFDWIKADNTLTFSKVIYSIDEKTGLSLELIDPTYSIKLSYYFDKQRKIWKQNVLYYPNQVVDTYYREATASMPSYKEEVECTMRTIDLSSDFLNGTGLIQDCGNRKRLYDNGIVVEFDKQHHFQTTSSMGTVEGFVYSDGYKIDNFSIKAQNGVSWSATMTENRLNSTIHFTDGSKYEGIVVTGDSFKYGFFASNLLLLDNIDIKLFLDGKFTKPNGEVITYTNGKAAISGYVETTPLLPSHNFSHIQVLTGDLSSVSAIDLPHRAYDNTLKNSKINEIQALVNNDAAEYFHIENIKTELQKKAFNQSEECKTIYLPRMQQERKNLFEDEYRATFSIKGSEIKDFKYNIKNGAFEFEMRDTKNAKINQGVSDFHILFSTYLCLSYPRSLIALTHHENNNGPDLYSQVVQTCKVSESDALKVENNIENCEIVWIFKFERVKGEYIYGKTTRIYIADKKTGEIYCDLTPSLKASQTKFKSVTTIKDKTPKRVYHANGRIVKCLECAGRGTGTSWRTGNTVPCSACGGKGWNIEHYW